MKVLSLPARQWELRAFFSFQPFRAVSLALLFFLASCTARTPELPSVTFLYAEKDNLYFYNSQKRTSIKLPIPPLDGKHPGQITPDRTHIFTFRDGSVSVYDTNALRSSTVSIPNFHQGQQSTLLSRVLVRGNRFFAAAAGKIYIATVNSSHSTATPASDITYNAAPDQKNISSFVLDYQKGIFLIGEKTATAHGDDVSAVHIVTPSKVYTLSSLNNEPITAALLDPTGKSIYVLTGDRGFSHHLYKYDYTTMRTRPLGLPYAHFFATKNTDDNTDGSSGYGTVTQMVHSTPEAIAVMFVIDPSHLHATKKSAETPEPYTLWSYDANGHRRIGSYKSYGTSLSLITPKTYAYIPVSLIPKAENVTIVSDGKEYTSTIMATALY